MNLTVCAPCGPGYDSSVGEWILLSALSVARVMIAQWDSSLSALPVARVQFLSYFKGLIPGWSHVLPCTQFREYQIAEWLSWKKAFSPMKIMRCLQISLVYGTQTKSRTMCWLILRCSNLDRFFENEMKRAIHYDFNLKEILYNYPMLNMKLFIKSVLRDGDYLIY